jgi:septal ring factor EnvC (AmiA/AmiB activator)
MTDLSVGFLFFVMLLMADFATQFGAADSVPRALYEEVVAERDAGRAELERLEQSLSEADAARKRPARELARAEAQVAELERLLAKRDPRNPLEAYLAAAHDERRRLLERLRTDLARLYPDSLIEVSPEGDALRF